MFEPRSGGISYDTDTGGTALFPDGFSPGTLNPTLCASVAQTLRVALNWQLTTGNGPLVTKVPSHMLF